MTTLRDIKTIKQGVDEGRLTPIQVFTLMQQHTDAFKHEVKMLTKILNERRSTGFENQALKKENLVIKICLAVAVAGIVVLVMI